MNYKIKNPDGYRDNHSLNSFSHYPDSYRD